MKSVAFIHAHPDDEALLSGGTLRALHQKGIKTIVIFLTNGQAGLSEEALTDDLGNLRQSEARTAAQILGVSKTYFLSFLDSGLDPNASPEGSLSTLDFDDVAKSVAAILDIENPDVVIGYDAQGGYGHPDHVVVHHVVRTIERQSTIPVILEVTVDRTLIASTLDRFRALISLFGTFGLINPNDVYALADGFSARADISYALDVRAYAAAKRSALKAHHSQNVGGVRNLRLMTMLPLFIFRRLFGNEFYVAVRDSADNPLRTLTSTKS